MSNSNESLFNILRIIPSWLIALALIGVIILSFMSYLSNTPFSFSKEEFGFGKCQPNSCITKNNQCGNIKLHIWTANQDKSSHQNETVIPVTRPNRFYYTDGANLTDAENKRGAAKWECVSQEK